MTAQAIKPRKADSFDPFGLGWRQVTFGRKVRITVRRLRRDHGALRGYVDVEYRESSRTEPMRLAGELVNLSSGRDRATFAGHIEERLRIEGLSWRNVVDAFCIEVERRDEEADPAVWIGQLPAPIDGGWLVEGILERGQNNNLVGDGAVGKSWVALALAVSVTTGLEVLPGYAPHLRGNALYVDYETDQDTLNARIQQIARGLGIEPPLIRYLRLDQPFADATERIMAECQEHGVVLVIIDSVEAAMAGSVGAGAPSNEGPARMNRALRRIGTTTFLVDHISAEQASAKGLVTKAFGSIFKRNWVRLSFQLKQAREPTPDGLRHLGLFNIKRNNGREFAPVGLAWEINDEVCRWTREEIADTELEEMLPKAERIAAYLRREGPGQPSTVAEALEISGATVRSILGRRIDLFEKNHHGLWGARARPIEREEEAYDEPEPLPF